MQTPADRAENLSASGSTKKSVTTRSSGSVHGFLERNLNNFSQCKLACHFGFEKTEQSVPQDMTRQMFLQAHKIYRFITKNPPVVVEGVQYLLESGKDIQTRAAWATP